MRLRSLSPLDMSLLRLWLNQAHVRLYFGDPKQWLGDIAYNLANADWTHYYLACLDGLPIGFVQLYETRMAPQEIWRGQPKATMALDYLIGPKEALGKGHGSRMVALAIEKAQWIGSANRLVADVSPENIASQKALAANGFRPAGGTFWERPMRLAPDDRQLAAAAF